MPPAFILLPIVFFILKNILDSFLYYVTELGDR